MFEFEWDAVKASINLQKHGVSFEEASSVFSDELSATAEDIAHSQVEARWVTFGYASTGRLLAVFHTEFGGTIRIISARQADRQERRIYENG